MPSLTPSTPPKKKKKKKKLYSEGVKMKIPENHIGSVPNFFEQQWFHSHGAGSQEGVQNYMPALASTQEAQHPVESIMKLHTPLHIWFMWMITRFRFSGLLIPGLQGSEQSDC